MVYGESNQTRTQTAPHRAGSGLDSPLSPTGARGGEEVKTMATQNRGEQPAPDAVTAALDMAVWFNGHIIQCQPDRERKGTTLTAARAAHAAMVKALELADRLATHAEAAYKYGDTETVSTRRRIAAEDAAAYRAARSQVGA